MGLVDCGPTMAASLASSAPSSFSPTSTRFCCSLTFSSRARLPTKALTAAAAALKSLSCSR